MAKQEGVEEGERVLDVIQVEGVHWPAGWTLVKGDRLVLVDGQVARIQTLPTWDSVDAMAQVLRLIHEGGLRCIGEGAGKRPGSHSEPMTKSRRRPEINLGGPVGSHLKLIP